MNYGYLGASLLNKANASQKDSQGMAQMWGQYAPQRSQQELQRRQFQVQQATSRMGQTDRMRNFGITALAGLMR